MQDNVLGEIGNAAKIMYTLIDELIVNLEKLEDIAVKVKGANEYLKLHAKRKREYSVVAYFNERYEEILSAENDDWDIQAEQIGQIIERVNALAHLPDEMDRIKKVF